MAKTAALFFLAFAASASAAKDAILSVHDQVHEKVVLHRAEKSQSDTENGWGCTPQLDVRNRCGESCQTYKCNTNEAGGCIWDNMMLGNGGCEDGRLCGTAAIACSSGACRSCGSEAGMYTRACYTTYCENHADLRSAYCEGNTLCNTEKYYQRCWGHFQSHYGSGQSPSWGVGHVTDTMYSPCLVAQCFNEYCNAYPDLQKHVGCDTTNYVAVSGRPWLDGPPMSGDTSSDGQTVDGCAIYVKSLGGKAFSFNPPDQHCIPYAGVNRTYTAAPHGEYQAYETRVGGCVTAEQAQRCNSHWITSGKAEGRTPNPENCIVTRMYSMNALGSHVPNQGFHWAGVVGFVGSTDIGDYRNSNKGYAP